MKIKSVGGYSYRGKWRKWTGKWTGKQLWRKTSLASYTSLSLTQDSYMVIVGHTWWFGFCDPKLTCKWISEQQAAPEGEHAWPTGVWTRSECSLWVLTNTLSQLSAQIAEAVHCFRRSGSCLPDCGRRGGDESTSLYRPVNKSRGTCTRCVLWLETETTWVKGRNNMTYIYVHFITAAGQPGEEQTLLKKPSCRSCAHSYK